MKITRNWKELNEYKKNLKLTKLQKEILVGNILGDVYLRKIGKHTRVAFEQKNKQYLFHLYEIFKSFVRTPPKERLQKRLKTSSIKSTWQFSTISHNDFDFFNNLFYLNNKKCLPNIKYIESYITPRCIAYWFMDDGSKKSKNEYVINTQSFTQNEHKILQKILLDKYNINTTIQGQKYKFIYIRANSSKNFHNLIKPYIVSSMLYKL